MDTETATAAPYREPDLPWVDFGCGRMRMFHASGVWAEAWFTSWMVVDPNATASWARVTRGIESGPGAKERAKLRAADKLRTVVSNNAALAARLAAMPKD